MPATRRPPRPAAHDLRAVAAAPSPSARPRSRSAARPARRAGRRGPDDAALARTAERPNRSSALATDDPAGALPGPQLTLPRRHRVPPRLLVHERTLHARALRALCEATWPLEMRPAAQAPPDPPHGVPARVIATSAGPTVQKARPSRRALPPSRRPDPRPPRRLPAQRRRRRRSPPGRRHRSPASTVEDDLHSLSRCPPFPHGWSISCARGRHRPDPVIAGTAAQPHRQRLDPHPGG